ncbi:MAG: site-specific integrase [Acidimicrobiia bacterium]
MSSPSRVRVSGPLEPYVARFRDELKRLGYRPNAVSSQLQLMAHLSRWLEQQRLVLSELTRQQLDEFLVDRRAEGYTMWLSPKALVPMLGVLRRLGVVPDAAAAVPETAADELIEAFSSYLTSERGLAAGTVVGYVFVARLFLGARSGDIDMAGLTAAEVTQFVLSEITDRSVGSAQSVACGLRAFLRFAYVTGRTGNQLDAAVPKVASWRLSRVPRSISPTDVAALLGSCDRRSSFGRRDYAAMVLMVRLGLRSGEVAALELSDIDWRAGEIVVRGKGNRVERLPLPVDVGEALAGWIRRGRPRCETRRVFTRIRAPHRGLSVGGVGNLVKAAALRADLDGVNAHRLRHTAATQMLSSGADLIEIGQVLRHTSVLTTAIYAKVDDQSLRPLALRWPVGAGS